MYIRVLFIIIPFFYLQVLDGSVLYAQDNSVSMKNRKYLNPKLPDDFFTKERIVNYFVGCILEDYHNNICPEYLLKPCLDLFPLLKPIGIDSNVSLRYEIINQIQDPKLLYWLYSFVGMHEKFEVCVSWHTNTNIPYSNISLLEMVIRRMQELNIETKFYECSCIEDR